MKKVLGAVLLILVAFGLWVMHRQRQIRVAFEHAVIGTQEIELVKQLGAPWRKSSCGQIFGGDMPKGCVTELLYAAPLAPATPEYWAFRYDNDGKLIGKYRYASP